ncbi:hypothetical protein [Moorena sp. SIO3H5]|uniref:hypothetical protein n=1 Tax=Moorena sp. SIO3H5 TaxID=2607834 RepID=UPI0013BD6F1E|nr:hypothetical protein [Moorena sp. SIO3H5]NEO70665.1 hypothetical protein [Moorena sp. SIO3H5]
MQRGLGGSPHERLHQNMKNQRNSPLNKIGGSSFYKLFIQCVYEVGSVFNKHS